MSNDIVKDQQAEIERLRNDITKWKARAQAMREYLGAYGTGSVTLWRDFRRTRPEATGWFDEDGVPR